MRSIIRAAVQAETARAEQGEGPWVREAEEDLRRALRAADPRFGAVLVLAGNPLTEAHRELDAGESTRRFA